MLIAIVLTWMLVHMSAPTWTIALTWIAVCLNMVGAAINNRRK